MRHDPIAPAPDSAVGQSLRFRDAETLFRNLQPTPDPEEGAFPAAVPSAQEAKLEPARRILPDLIAEAAISEQVARSVPELRRRGRPPKVATGDVSAPRKRGRPPKPALVVTAESADVPDLPAPVVPAVLYFSASERRRAARATQGLPRGERWKRRMPRVCW